MDVYVIYFHVDFFQAYGIEKNYFETWSYYKKKKKIHIDSKQEAKNGEWLKLRHIWSHRYLKSEVAWDTGKSLKTSPK